MTSEQPTVISSEPTVISSADERIELGPAKAIVAAIGGALVGALTALATGLADGAVTPEEWVTVGLGFILGSGIVGLPTYAARTNVTIR